MDLDEIRREALDFKRVKARGCSTIEIMNTFLLNEILEVQKKILEKIKLESDEKKPSKKPTSK